MTSNNYIAPYYFTQPPPNLNSSSSWAYNWSTNQTQTQTARSAQSISRLAPPPPPPPYPPPTSSRVSASVPAAKNTDYKPQVYYNSSPAAAYRIRRYNNNSTTGQYNGSTSQYSAQHGLYSSSSAGQYNSVPSGQYMTSSSYSSNSSGYNSSSSGYSRSYYGKRKNDLESDNSKKSSKKKKKPLSQNVPQRKDWSVVEAKRALTVEKDYNKRNKSQSLIIKFPDLELNRDIVSKFNPAIESVHFQQPSTPRFCFVTLKDLADPEEIIKELNKTPFGHGFLTAEYKRDREDDINIGPEDIDPLTLYVGNLAQEVTKEDMVNTYPKQKRIDIGYAKKMKYTRYAFVSFKTVDDSIEAFQKTHATQMYSKSLIVRFRRLNGTVGMPGEPKPQMPQRNDTGEPNNYGSNTSMNDHNDSGSHNNSSDIETDPRQAPWEMVDVSNWETEASLIKEEPPGDTDDEDDAEMDKKPPLPNYVSPFMPGSLERAISLHKPKKAIKEEPVNGESSIPNQNISTEIPTNNESNALPQAIKSEQETCIGVGDNNDCLITNKDKIKKETEKTDAMSTYDMMRLLHKKRNTNFVPIKVKREASSTPTLDELSTTSNDCGESTSNVDTEDMVTVKSEPIDEGNETNEETNDGDNDSSDSDFNFSNILNSMATHTRKKIFKKSLP